MRVALGVGGGIAAYKAAELVRALTSGGAAVQVVMTDSAQRFITPLTFAALTGRKVITSLFSSAGDEDTLSSSIEHIRVAQEHDILVVAPATADLMAQFSHGLARDFLTTLYLAFTGPVVLAPAMNTNMWLHPATQDNCKVLESRGHIIVSPGDGPLACGMVGPGRMAEPMQIAEVVLSHNASKKDLDGETLLLTAGPTREALDPVRFISNHSSGKMGYALAAAAARRGARVILVSGPVKLPPPDGVQIVQVESAAQMRAAVLQHLDASTIIIKSAAVADYHLENPPKQKVKKTAARLSLDLTPTPDILAELGRKKGGRLLIGFAAETSNMVAEARRKMETKNCDMVVGNLVNQAGLGFDSDENEVTLVMRTGETVQLPRASKRAIAESILDHLLKLRLALYASS
ncbi:MAG: bifunctional phosphopantothenoylcysteine decarboxylase/phosphopantothenate--cysteine ligase CoaBC [Acidobacteriia bacterium]|nr:bifunctional phosphopantothenoylcysteine decarboxylase/phosphopantothenate--cysteine ligase CoaBC [Terriglobia bacterium]